MSKKPEYIQLEAGEDVNSVRDRLSFMRGQRVLLIWPEEGTALTRKLDLVLIQREAMRRAIRLALVTHDPAVIEHAQELNISTFETIGSSERGRWKRGRAKVFTTRYQRPRDEPDPEDLMEVASRVRTTRRHVSRLWRGLTRLVIMLLLFGVLAVVAYVLVPQATVTVSLAQELVSLETEVVADPTAPDVDVDNRVIPVTQLRVEVEQTAAIPTTGRQPLPGVLATGSVIFVNRTERVITIPAGTIVSTGGADPVQFQTTQSASLPAGEGQQLEVAIEAMSAAAGEQGNVESGMINTVIGPLENSVTVFNLTPSSGGEARTQPVVTIDDQASLLGAVRGLLQAQAYTAMLPSLREGQRIIESTIRIVEERSDWKQFSAQPGDIADQLSLTMRAVVEAVVIDQKLAQQIVVAQMASQIARGRLIRPESLAYACCEVLEVDENQRITLRISGSGVMEGQVNMAQLQERLAGKPLDEALRYLATELDLQEGTTPTILISPDWLGQMPILPLRIAIRVETPT